MAKSRKKGRPRDRTAAALPEELIMWEILLRLPVKDILRCRAVCHAWRHRSSAPDFLLAHHRRQPSLLLVYSDFGRTLDAAFDALDLRQRPAERQPVFRIRDLLGYDFINEMYRHWFKLHASRDGLILLSLPTGRFYLCNPATRQWISLWRLRDAGVAGMYSPSPTGEYRVLFWNMERRPSATISTAIYYVHTVSSPASAEEPRCIGQPIASPSIQGLVEHGLIPRSDIEGQPILLHDCLYWVREEKGIVVFDTVRESFRLMHLPNGACQLVAESPAFWHLFEMEGTLGVSWGIESETMLKLWVLQDYETEAWSLRYQIDFSVVKTGSKSMGKFQGMTVFENGDVLVHCYGSFWVYHLNNKGKLLQTLDRDYLTSWVTGLGFKESLFRHAFLEGSRASRELQFFVGL